MSEQLALQEGLSQSATVLGEEWLAGMGGEKTLGTVQRERVVEALAGAGGNKSQAARALGISRGTLYNMIKRYGL